MTDPDPNQVDPATIDTGRPIAALRSLEEPASATFSERLHHRIHRRWLGADLGRLTWEGPLAVMVEFLKMLFGLVGGGPSDNRRKR
jgi:hypothetical protein